MDLALVMANTSQDTVLVNLSIDQGLAFDPKVDSLNGHEVWSREHDAVIGGAALSFTMPPQGTDTFKTTWDLKANNGLRLAPGQYQMRAGVAFVHDTLVASNSPFRFTIAP